MEHGVIEFFIFVALATLLGKKLESNLKIPLVMSLITISVVAGLFVHIGVYFIVLMVALLPLLLIPDVLLLNGKELLKKSKSVTYIAFFAVIFSVVVGSYFTAYLYPNIPIVLFVVVYSIIMATDAVSVSAIFSKFPVPHKIKFYAESESLFNDATAVIIFSLISAPMALGYSIDACTVGFGMIKIIVVSTTIGVVFGYLFSYLMSYYDDALDEFLFILLSAYTAFLTAEMLHVSGILAVVSSIMLFKRNILKNLDHFANNVTKRLLTTKERLADNEKLIGQLSFIAVAMLFVSLGSVISIKEIIDNIGIILAVFLITTVIRFSTFVPMLKTGMNFKDIIILTLGGVKGGLAVVLVHSIPDTFEYKSLAEVIVFGQILLSIFVYIPLMMYLVPKFYKKESCD